MNDNHFENKFDTVFKIENMSIKEMERIEDICIQIVDRSGRTICYSKGCEMIEGLKRENVIGKTIPELYTVNVTEDNPYGSIPLTVLKTGKVMKNNHVKFTTSLGNQMNVISSTYPIFSEDSNQVEAAICIFRDIGDYLKMAQTIQKLEKDLAQEKIKRKSNGTIYAFSDVIGKSPATLACIEKSKKAALSTAPIMIFGSTGTGKEVFAQSIHNESLFSTGPFVGVNCSAIPENLLESTLFGTCKGAFTGADETKGLFETAEGGTLFLDEINSMSVNLQAKLLRALETKHVRKVGGNNEIPINVRIISATNQDPIKSVKDGLLRDDFYYRLAVINLFIPDLKNRLDDIPELVRHFLIHHSVVMGKKITEVSPEIYTILFAHKWPGNIRELKHVIDQSLYLADINDTMLEPRHLPNYIIENHTTHSVLSKYEHAPTGSIKDTLLSIERQMILDAFEKHGNNISETARSLGMTRQNLQHKLRTYDIK
ncbi:MAG: sigma 54-interacting transcriptional regulator [Tissierellales bacterium]|nr:sigma 54-interacting transcriptional regulator [Tissierellales bacterium]MBN2826693.1 sigma 54-interacting transcriptional regulator [Tissierellales bacterium]